MDRQTASIKIPTDIRYLAAIQSFVAENAKLVNLQKREIMKLNLAVEEAVTNVIKHAFLPEEKATFDVFCEMDSIEFKVIIKDMGMPFDPNLVEEYCAETELEGKEKSGLGFRLMKGAVDKLTFLNKGYGGKEVHMVKFVEQKHIDEFLKTEDMKAYEIPVEREKTDSLKVSYHTEFLRAKQAVEISQCAYRTYGYTYIMENIYYPNRLIEMTNTGELISAVAVTDDNEEVMSHCALERFGRKKNIPEIGMAFTKPKYRGLGCMGNLNILLLKKAEELGLKGIYAKGVTTHPYSQKALVKGGYKECAILIGLSPAKTFAKMEVQGAQRETLVIYYLKLLEQNKLNLFCPAMYKKMIERIYDHINLKANLIIPDKKVEPNTKIIQSDLEIEISDNLNYANIYINCSGKNLVLELKHRIKELCQKKIEAINIYIDMCDEFSISKVDQIEKLGFFFAGVFPDDQKQYLIIQFLNNVPIDYSRIVMVTDFASRILEYVKRCDPN